MEFELSRGVGASCDPELSWTPTAPGAGAGAGRGSGPSGARSSGRRRAPRTGSKTGKATAMKSKAAGYGDSVRRSKRLRGRSPFKLARPRSQKVSAAAFELRAAVPPHGSLTAHPLAAVVMFSYPRVCGGTFLGTWGGGSCCLSRA